MSGYPRRSPRLSQQYHRETSFDTSTPTSSLSSSSLSSAYATSHPSPTNEPPSLAGQQHDQLRLQINSQFLSVPFHSPAPLPSPSADEPVSYMTQAQSLTPFAMPQQSQQNGQQAQHPQQPQTSQHHNSFSQSQRPNMSASSHGQGQVPPDFLAEAAKRAQMACLMRDLGDVTL